MIKFNHKQIVLAAVFGCLIIWLLRFDLRDYSNESKSRSLEPIVLPVINQRAKWLPNELEKRLVAFVPKKETVEIAKVETPAVAAPVKPPPKPVDKTLNPMFSLLDNDHQVGLIAIIQESDEKFAILQKINFATSATENIKVKDTDEFSGLTLSISSQTQIQLNNSNKEIVLNLFKPRNS